MVLCIMVVAKRSDEKWQDSRYIFKLGQKGFVNGLEWCKIDRGGNDGSKIFGLSNSRMGWASIDRG